MYPPVLPVPMSSEEENKKDVVVKNFEGAIPLLIILIIGLFAAGKLGIVDLSSIPILGDIVGKQTIKVACIGSCSPGVMSYLRSKEATLYNIQLTATALPPETVTSSKLLKKFDVVIVQNTPYCDLPVRRALRKYVQAGGKLILIEDSCVKVHGDESVFGWGVELQDVVPVVIGGVSPTLEPPEIAIVNGDFEYLYVDHPILGRKGVAGIKNVPFNGKVINVVPYGNYEVIATITARLGSMTKTYFAIVEGNYMLGKTIYFAYDPGMYGEMYGKVLFLNVIKYLTHQD